MTTPISTTTALPTVSPQEDAALHRSFCSDVHLRKIGSHSYTTWSAADAHGNPLLSTRYCYYRTTPDACSCPDKLHQDDETYVCKHQARVRFERRRRAR